MRTLVCFGHGDGHEEVEISPTENLVMTCGGNEDSTLFDYSYSTGTSSILYHYDVDVDDHMPKRSPCLTPSRSRGRPNDRTEIRLFHSQPIIMTDDNEGNDDDDDFGTDAAYLHFNVGGGRGNGGKAEEEELSFVERRDDRPTKPMFPSVAKPTSCAGKNTTTQPPTPSKEVLEAIDELERVLADVKKAKITKDMDTRKQTTKAPPAPSPPSSSPKATSFTSVLRRLWCPLMRKKNYRHAKVPRQKRPIKQHDKDNDDTPKPTRTAAPRTHYEWPVSTWDRLFPAMGRIPCQSDCHTTPKNNSLQEHQCKKNHAEMTLLIPKHDKEDKAPNHMGGGGPDDDTISQLASNTSMSLAPVARKKRRFSKPYDMNHTGSNTTKPLRSILYLLRGRRFANISTMEDDATFLSDRLHHENDNALLDNTRNLTMEDSEDDSRDDDLRDIVIVTKEPQRFKNDEELVDHLVKECDKNSSLEEGFQFLQERLLSRSFGGGANHRNNHSLSYCDDDANNRPEPPFSSSFLDLTTLGSEALHSRSHASTTPTPSEVTTGPNTPARICLTSTSTSTSTSFTTPTTTTTKDAHNDTIPSFASLEDFLVSSSAISDQTASLEAILFEQELDKLTTEELAELLDAELEKLIREGVGI